MMQLQQIGRQVWQWLQQIGRRMAALVVALLMPIGLMFGFWAQVSGRNRAEAFGIHPDQAATLTYWVPPQRGYEEVPQLEATDRRGLMTEWRADLDRPLSLTFDPASEAVGSTLLPGWVVLIQPEPTVWHYQTILPEF